MKILKQSKVTVIDGKKGKTEVLVESKSVMDSIADDLVVDSEQELKRAINLTGIEELSAKGDKIVKRKEVIVWEENKEEMAKREAEQKAREEAAEKARLLAEQQAKEEAERKAQEEADAKAKLLAEQKAKEEAEARAKAQQLAEQGNKNANNNKQKSKEDK